MPTKTLQYAFYRSKNHLRVQVIRKIRKLDEQDKVTFQTITIGTFNLYKNKEVVDPAMFDDKLTPTERVELREFLYSVNFGKDRFNESADYFGRDILRLSQGFVDATLEAAIAAQTQGIEFNPHQIMIEALLVKIKALEQDLKVDILAKHGYHEA